MSTDLLIGYPPGNTVRLSAGDVIDVLQDRRGWRRMEYILPPDTVAEVWKKEESGELSSTAARQVLAIIMQHNDRVLLRAVSSALESFRDDEQPCEEDE